MNRPNLLTIMCGLPQSGKSSTARDLGHPIVNRDSIRKAIGGSIRYFKEEKRVSEIEEIMVDSLFNAGHREVIVDACHLKISYRKRWDDFARSRGYAFYIHNILTSLETCLTRAARNYPDEPNFLEVIRNMWKKSSTTVGGIPEKQSDHWS